MGIVPQSRYVELSKSIGKRGEVSLTVVRRSLLSDSSRTESTTTVKQLHESFEVNTEVARHYKDNKLTTLQTNCLVVNLIVVYNQKCPIRAQKFFSTYGPSRHRNAGEAILCDSRAMPKRQTADCHIDRIHGKSL